MSRNPEYQFVDTSVDELVSLLVQGYEQITGEAVYPSSPERVLIQWAASIPARGAALPAIFPAPDAPDVPAAPAGAGAGVPADATAGAAPKAVERCSTPRSRHFLEKVS